MSTSTIAHIVEHDKTDCLMEEEISQHCCSENMAAPRRQRRIRAPPLVLGLVLHLALLSVACTRSLVHTHPVSFTSRLIGFAVSGGVVEQRAPTVSHSWSFFAPMTKTAAITRMHTFAIWSSLWQRHEQVLATFNHSEAVVRHEIIHLSGWPMTGR